MSQIAIGYTPTQAAVAEVIRLSSAGDRERAEAALLPYEFVPFDWSGYGVVVLYSWLAEQGIELPVSETPLASGLAALWTNPPLLCAGRAETAALLAELEELHPSGEELAAFWGEFTGESSPEDVQFMAAGWDWLLNLIRAGRDSEWCVLVVI